MFFAHTVIDERMGFFSQKETGPKKTKLRHSQKATQLFTSRSQAPGKRQKQQQLSIAVLALEMK